MVKMPMSLDNPKGAWHNSHLTKVERKKPYLIVTSMLYMCNGIGAGEAFKHQMISFFASHQDISPSKLGFPYDPGFGAYLEYVTLILPFSLPAGRAYGVGYLHK